jgi:hypothetical protein
MTNFDHALMLDHSMVVAVVVVVLVLIAVAVSVAVGMAMVTEMCILRHPLTEVEHLLLHRAKFVFARSDDMAGLVCALQCLFEHSLPEGTVLIAVVGVQHEKVQPQDETVDLLPDHRGDACSFLSASGPGKENQRSISYHE